MNNFEQQIFLSAQRIKSKDNSRLSVAPSPIPSSRSVSWGWIATPVAAAIGIAVGVFAPRVFSGESSVQQDIPTTASVRTVRVLDTIVLEKIVRDTVYMSPAPVLMAANTERLEQSPASSRQGSTAPADTMGKCILDDGVDYSLLASF